MVSGQHGADRFVHIKICGITNPADANYAVSCGADVLGFNFFPGSKRYVDFRSAKAWLTKLPPEVPKVAVLVNPTWDEAVELSRFDFINSLQLHGNESAEFCRRLAEHDIPFSKALPVTDENSLRQIPQFFTDTVVLDSSSMRGFGGSGEMFPWEWGQRFVESHPDLRVVLAGGLTPENVAEAVRQVCPFGVDVTTGVESYPGRKDHRRLEAFVSAVRGQ